MYTEVNHPVNSTPTSDVVNNLNEEIINETVSTSEIEDIIPVTEDTITQDTTTQDITTQDTTTQDTVTEEVIPEIVIEEVIKEDTVIEDTVIEDTVIEDFVPVEKNSIEESVPDNIQSNLEESNNIDIVKSDITVNETSVDISYSQITDTMEQDSKFETISKEPEVTESALITESESVQVVKPEPIPVSEVQKFLVHKLKFPMKIVKIIESSKVKIGIYSDSILCYLNKDDSEEQFPVHIYVEKKSFSGLIQKHFTDQGYQSSKLNNDTVFKKDNHLVYLYVGDDEDMGVECRSRRASRDIYVYNCPLTIVKNDSNNLIFGYEKGPDANFNMKMLTINSLSLNTLTRVRIFKKLGYEFKSSAAIRSFISRLSLIEKDFELKIESDDLKELLQIIEKSDS